MKILERRSMQILWKLSRGAIINSTHFFRSVMTTSRVRSQAEKAAEELKLNPFYEKYAHKIAAMQQTSPEEFLSRFEARKEEKSNAKSCSTTNRQYSSLLEPKKHLKACVETVDDELDKIMKIELILNKDASEIANIWQEYHRKKDCIAAAIPAKSFDEINIKAKKFPTFLLPIPRSQGYEFIVLQFFRNTVHFTPLLNYQVHKENAPECLTITHYPELKESKGIVLMRGEYDKNVLNVQEAQCLANQLQLYYSQNDPQKINLLEQFTFEPDKFKHMDLIKQIETLSIS